MGHDPIGKKRSLDSFSEVRTGQLQVFGLTASSQQIIFRSRSALSLRFPSWCILFSLKKQKAGHELKMMQNQCGPGLIKFDIWWVLLEPPPLWVSHAFGGRVHPFLQMPIQQQPAGVHRWFRCPSVDTPKVGPSKGFQGREVIRNLLPHPWDWNCWNTWSRPGTRTSENGYK